MTRIPWNKGIKYSEEQKSKLNTSGLRLGASYLVGKKRLDMIGDKNPHYGKFGKAHPCWRNVKKHAFHKLIRELFKYRQWRSDVFTRDDFTCVLCGVRGCYLEADHFPKRFIEIIIEYNIDTLDKAVACEELWNINNGRTLCKNCHNPTKGRYKKGLTKL